MPVYGFLANFGARRFPKGNEGKTQGGLPLGNPVCLWQTELFKLNLKSSPSSSGYNRRRRLATGRSGKQQAERTAVRTAPIVCPEESPLVRPQAHTPVPERPDAPTTARLVGLPPRGGQYFLSKRKKVPKKASGTATPGKRLLLPILTAGLAMSRAAWLARLRMQSCALVLTLFLFQKGQGFFPPLPIAALLRRRMGGDGAQPLRVGL